MPRTRIATASIYWGGLAIVVTAVALYLTHVITYVAPGASEALGIAFDERPYGARPRLVAKGEIRLAEIDRLRFQVPRVAIIGYDEILLVVTPGTRAVTLFGQRPIRPTCEYSEEIQSNMTVPEFARLSRTMPVVPLAVASDGAPVDVSPQALAISGMYDGRIHLWRAAITIPEPLHAKLQRTPLGEAAIRCTFAQSLAATPTFTDRAMMLSALNLTSGLVAFDFSAFDGIDNLQFSGGLDVPQAGDRIRLLGPHDRWVAVEWNDEAAAEQRDIVLVLIGGLAAVAAAMAIEAIRPAVEGRIQGSGD